MYKIDNATAATVLPSPDAIGPNPDSFFTRGTQVTADWLNAVQEEICYVITQSGATLDKTDRTQLYTAIHDIMVAFAGLTQVVEDTSPSLGGDLAVSTYKIKSAAGDVLLEAVSGTIDLNAPTVLINTDLVHRGDTNNKITFGTNTQNYQAGGSSIYDISASGLRVGAANARVTTIDDDTTLAANSATRLATQHAIKQYGDNLIPSATAVSNGPLIFWSTSTISAGQTRYFAMGNVTSTAPTTTTGLAYSMYIPFAGSYGVVVSYSLSNPPGAGQSFTFTLMVNGSAASALGTISGTAANGSNSISAGTLSPGDYVCIQIVASAGAASINQVAVRLNFG